MITTSRWSDVQRVLDAVLELPEAEVRAYLERACGSDTVLRREVEDLWRSCVNASGFLEHPPSQLAAALLEDRPGHEGRRIGPYVVTGEAGRGGMGVVYLAERSDGQFRQRVALKVLPRGLESDLAIRRFLEERQILASLAHRGIARLLDGGVTDDELPYFAMEYVEGTSIDRYCDETGASIERRLQLFMDVCDAVQYAHQNLVVHRDLKPTNILVTPDGSIKLLDFGIAKLVSEETTGADEMTRTGSRWLTPRYASPEQVCGKPVTTVSDVYTLGVLLYELLTGRSPYQLDALTPQELSQAVCETDVARPSVTVMRREPVSQGDADGSGTFALVRGFRPDRLARRLRGDIDTIVLKAMQKDPARRYSSAGALAEDVRRHLEGQPIRARPDTLGYRASKFVRRHRVGVTVGAALAVSLIAGVVGIAWQGAVASRERVRAERQAATAARASQLLVEMFRLSDPDVARGETVTAREILARGTQRVEADFANDSVLQAAMLREIGQIYVNLGLPDSAERLVRRAVSVWRGSGASTELAAAIHQLGDIEAARARNAEAEVHYREALVMRRSLYREPHDDIAVSARGLADALANQRKYDEVDSLYNEALDIERHTHGVNSPHVASTLFSHAATYHDRGKFKEAGPLFREAVEIYRRVPGSTDPIAASARLNLAKVLAFGNEFAEAEPLYREAVQLRKAMYPPGHPATIEALSGLGSLLFRTSRFREAESVMREALQTGSATLGPEHPDVLETKQILGNVLYELGQYAEADRWLTEALDQWRAHSGPDAPLSVVIQIQRGDNRLAAGRVSAAETDFRGAIATGRRSAGTTPFVGQGIRGLARVAAERGQLVAAEAGFREAVTTLGPGRRNSLAGLSSRRFLAETISLLGRHAEADSILSEVVPAAREALGKGNIELGRALQAHGEVRMRRGDARTAETLLREALAVRVVALGADHWYVAETESTLGAALAAQDRHGEAQPLLSGAYDRLVAQRGANDRLTRQARARLDR